MAKIKYSILYITHSPIIGGAEISLVNHLKVIDKKKFKIYLLAGKKMKSLVEEIDGITFIEMKFFLLHRPNPMVLINYAKMVWNIVKVARKYDIDIIHSNSVKSHYIANMASLICRKKLIWWIRDATFNRYLYYFLYFIPQKVVSVSKYIKDAYIPSYKSEVVYNGSDAYLKNYLDEELENIRKELGVKGKFVIGCVERLVRSKGVIDLIKAFESLLKDNEDIILIVSGSGSNERDDVEKSLKKYVGDKKLEKSVIFLGWRDDTAKLMRIFDVLVHPAVVPEPFGLVVLEAMMCKCLVITSDAGAPKEFIKSGKRGVIYKAGDMEDLRMNLKNVVDNNVDRQRMIDNAYEYSIRNLTQKIETKKIEKIYEGVMHKV